LPRYNLQLGKPVRHTFEYLEEHAKVILFYELFEFTKYTKPTKPKTIFLAHGSALKDFLAMYPRRKEIVKQYDYMAGLGPAVKEGFIRQGIDPAKLVNIGVARTDELYAIKKQRGVREQVAREVGFDPSKKIVSYFTTFWGASSIYNTAKEILKYADERYVVLFQLHPQTPERIHAEYDEIIKDKPNVFWSYDSIYPSLTLPNIMAASDLIMGDVSSVVLEALLMDKPMIFVYDMGEHRQSMDDYKNIRDVVGWSEHIDMDNVEHVNDIFETALAKGINRNIWRVAQDRNFYHHDGTSVQAIADFVRSLS
jgi:CDP-glycerol glycerophosphotransferase (TagB/SpsB family)